QRRPDLQQQYQRYFLRFPGGNLVLNTEPNLLRGALCGLRCSPGFSPAALLSHKSLPLATVLFSVDVCNADQPGASFADAFLAPSRDINAM
ncbi:hypothetical protein, partial [Janthinobacterium sp. HH107]|uniref:hypothetical protein n=1 Tax=Janthinobacterium sp. HH107 TaxID=1537279 RepID=UPI001C403E43